MERFVRALERGHQRLDHGDAAVLRLVDDELVDVRARIASKFTTTTLVSDTSSIERLGCGPGHLGSTSRRA